jgi:outer membrane lipoprotein-sorting protein
MAELDEQESEFARLLQELRFDDSPRPEHAELLRQQALARFDRATWDGPARFWWRQAINQGRETMRRPLPRIFVAAAACAAVLTGWLLLPGRSATARDFNEFVDAFVQAKTAAFQMDVAIEGQPKQSFKAWYQAPAHFRQELGNLVNISDFAANKIVNLNPPEKTAMIMNFTGVPKNKPSDNYFERLRNLLSGNQDAKDAQVERLGEHEMDGKKVLGFRFDTPAAMVTLWGDPKTGLPVRIENVWKIIPRTDVTMNNFEFNVALKDSLFDVNPPQGYKVQTIDVDASEARESDLVHALGACSYIGDGSFPETLDTAGVNKLIMKYALSQGKNISEDKIQQLMKQAIEIGRGSQFALQLPESADAHYAGKDVKRGQKDRPIFWFKPESAKEYRVIDADLSVHDAEKAPEIAGAQRLGKPAKTDQPKPN